MIKYEVFIEQPSLDFYRLSHSPREDYTLAGIWPWVVVTGASGKLYHGIRGLEDTVQGSAVTYYFMEPNKLENAGEVFAPDLYPELFITQMEPYEYSESADAVHFVGENVRFDFRVGSYDWSDAKGRFEIHAEQLGEVFTFWIPEQEDITLPLYYRSEMGKATGQINGDPVEGLAALDYSFSRLGTVWYFTPFMYKVEKQWSMWLAEYTDGEIEGGLAWKGRDNTGFGAAHLLRNGVSTALSDARVFTTCDERGAVRKSRIELSGEVVELEQDAYAFLFNHTFGRVVSTSRGKEIAKSWAYIESIPENQEEAVQKTMPARLRGEGVRDIMRGVRLENERLVFPE